jgi:hypothetical protein
MTEQRGKARGRREVTSSLSSQVQGVSHASTIGGCVVGSGNRHLFAESLIVVCGMKDRQVVGNCSPEQCLYDGSAPCCWQKLYTLSTPVRALLRSSQSSLICAEALVWSFRPRITGIYHAPVMGHQVVLCIAALWPSWGGRRAEDNWFGWNQPRLDQWEKSCGPLFGRCVALIRSGLPLQLSNPDRRSSIQQRVLETCSQILRAKNKAT